MKLLKWSGVYMLEVCEVEEKHLLGNLAKRISHNCRSAIRFGKPTGPKKK